MGKILKTEIKLCPCCMEHYKGKYCANADEYYEDEDMMKENHEKMEEIYENSKSV